MCTVTYLPLGNNNFILTSNRDESPRRRTIPPKKYDENGVTLTYPKDELAGGTWIGLSEKNRLVCLLNGGFTKHKRNESYRMSRGVIVKEILTADDAMAHINNYNFENIEPFTIVLVDWNTQLETYELVWDGETKHFKKLNQTPHIWSSSTLYDEEMKQLRRTWFADWLTEQDTFQQENILTFHKDDKKGTAGTSLKMKRPNVETVSITSVEKITDNVEVTYLDFLKNSERN